MEITTIDKVKIQQIYSAYQTEYGLHLPIISKIKLLQETSSWARIMNTSLYNKEYILLVPNSLLSKSNKFIKQILYHEFTHIADSLKFLHLPENDFSTIMTSYSEFHASKREIRKALSFVESPISLNSTIMRTKELTIETFIKQSCEMLLFDFNKMDKNCGIENFYYNTNRLYYYFGYLSALKENNLNVPFNALKIPAVFQTTTSKIYNIINEDDIDLESLRHLQNELEDDIKKNAMVNQILKETI